MSDVTATIRVESPDLALTETVAHDDSAIVRPITGAGTVPDSDGYLFTIRSADFDRFEEGLRRDPTIAAFERVTEGDEEAIYRFEYSAEATLLSPLITAADGVSLRIENEGTAWTMRIWLPDRSALSSLWTYASDRGIDFSLERVNEYANPLESDAGLTDAQEEALLIALEAGYFEEPREAALEDVADELEISQPAAGGLLRRGIKRLLLSTVAADRDPQT